MEQEQEIIIFKCPECGKKLSVGKDKANLAARCPACGKRIKIPKGNK